MSKDIKHILQTILVHETNEDRRGFASELLNMLTDKTPVDAPDLVLPIRSVPPLRGCDVGESCWHFTLIYPGDKCLCSNQEVVRTGRADCSGLKPRTVGTSTQHTVKRGK